jgi:hypothetical protein
MLPLMTGQTTRGGHLWALAAPILMAIIAWLVGLLMFDVFGANYLRGLFRRLLHLVR